MLSAAILFLLSAKPAGTFGLFSADFLHPCNTRVQATGDILAIDRDLDYDPASVKWLEIDTSFYYLNLLRDSVSLNNFARNFSFWLDTIILPGFQMYDDTGTVSTILPVSAVLGVKYQFVKNSFWYAGLSVMGGMEFISDFNYMFNVLYGMTGSAGWTPLENLTVGLIAGFSGEHTNFQFLNGLLEAGARYRLGSLDMMGSFAFEGNYITVKAGFVYRVTKGFSVLWGGNYTLEYNGWNVTGGIDFSQFKLFNADSRAGLSVVYNLVAGPSFTLTLNMDFPVSVKENSTNENLGGIKSE